MRKLDDKIQRNCFFFYLLQVSMNQHLILYYDSIDRITICLNINILSLNKQMSSD